MFFNDRFVSPVLVESGVNEVITMLIASLLESLVSVSVLPEIVLQSL